MSSMHHTNTIIENKPEIIHFYNDTKGGVDALDKKCACYKVGRRTRRWPQAIWFRIMDVAGVNSNVIFNCVAGNQTMARRNFLTMLGRQLIQEHLERRVQEKRLPRELRSLIYRIGNIDETEPMVAQQPVQGRKRGRCHLCPYSQKKESVVCNLCHHYICKNHKHIKILCDNCLEK